MSQHIAGFPMEELLLAASLAAAPMLAYLGLQIKSTMARLRRAVIRRTTVS